MVLHEHLAHRRVAQQERAKGFGEHVTRADVDPVGVTEKPSTGSGADGPVESLELQALVSATTAASATVNRCNVCMRILIG